MTAIPQPNASRFMSERLAKPLREVARREWKLHATRGLLHLLACGLSAVLVASLLLGYGSGAPAWARMTVAAVTWATVLAASIRFLRPVLRRRTLAGAAFIVERRIPGLDERISSAVELTAEHGPFAGSPALVGHLFRQAEADADAVRAEAIVPADGLKRSAVLLAPPLLAWIVLAVLIPRPLFAGLYHVLLPWRDRLPAVLTTVVVTPGDVTVAEGDALQVTAKVKLRSGPDRQVQRATLLTREAGAERALAHDLDRAGEREFTASLADLRQSFTYHVSTDQGDSAWYTATVLPRPSVRRLDLRYDYPAYAGIHPKVQPNSDGAIKALQGTDVTLTIRGAGELDLGDGKSGIAITEGARRREAPLRSVAGEDNVYEARLTVFNSGSYRLRLVNRHGLSNQDDHPRPIIAELDQPPKAAITTPPAEITARADDDVPITFTASDDFGIAGLRAMVQIDDRPAEPVDVDLSRTPDRRDAKGTWELVVPVHLARAGVPDAARITYWLRATDNRDPDPQSAESAKQTIRIDNGQPLAYRTRIEQQLAKDLIQAIDRAIQRLHQAQWPVNSLKDIDRNRPMNDGEKTRAREQREHLATTSGDLADAAESNLNNAYRTVATKAKEIAESPIRSAAENVARSLLSADQPEPRTRAAAEAAEQMTDARKQLEELKKQVEARSKELTTARELEKLARKQAELARSEQIVQADKKQRDRERVQQRQRELAELLQRAVGESEPLREPKATEQAIRLRELLDRVQQLQKDQAPLTEQIAKQQEVTQLQQQARDLAARQRELNEAIAKFSAEQRAPLQRAGTRAPDPSHQAGIVDRLRQNEPQPAHDMQRQSVEQLKQAASQLQERGRSPELRPDAIQQYVINQREQDKPLAQQAADEAKRAGEQLKQAKNAEQLADAQKAVEQSAQALTGQARAAIDAVREPASSNDATARKNAAQANQAADATQAAVEAALVAAHEGEAQQASRKLEEAGTQLAKAQQAALDATRADFLADQQAASATAAQLATELSEKQAELAEATKQAAVELETARRDQQSPQDVANRQNQLKDQVNQAAEQADRLEKLAESNNPALARRAAAAEQLLRDAASAEAHAAQAEQSLARAHEQASQATRQAAQANQQAARLDQQSAEASAQAAEAHQQADIARRQVDDAQARKDEPTAQVARQQANQAKQKAVQNQRQAENLRQQSAAAGNKSSDAVKQAERAGAAAASSQQQSAQHQALAGKALARAEDALRDVNRMAADAAARRDPENETAASGSGEAQPAADERASAEGQQAANDQASKTPSSPPQSLTPEQAMRQAAQGAQEAVQAQQQAMSNHADADAIRQAAAALEQAASAMSAATASTNDSGESAVAGADEQAESGGDARRAQHSAAGSASARTVDSRTGTGTGAGSHDGRPQSVQELGISAGDWARLGPLTRQELLNAAQQSGPPAYREMIKNYYVRIARLADAVEDPKSPPRK